MRLNSSVTSMSFAKIKLVNLKGKEVIVAGLDGDSQENKLVRFLT